MNDPVTGRSVQDEVNDLYRDSSRKIYATLVRLLNDFDLAEEAMHDAFATAVEIWGESGIPSRPEAWLISTGRNKAIDAIRRNEQFRRKQPDVQARLERITESNAVQADQEIADDRLRLIFTCCHPAIAEQIQIPLTLREVCGLSTEEIAQAFLTSPSTMAQRIVRGKAKVREARIPYIVPSEADLPERLDSVLSVIYLVFNEGYSASTGETLTRVDLSEEAIRLCRLLRELLPDPEVTGLLALMLLHESRRTARFDEAGDLILLEDQDRSLWNRGLIAEGTSLIEEAFSSGEVGSYSLQAAISSVHASSRTPEETDWTRIVSLYDLLLRAEPSPVVELNRAVAVAMRDSPQAGLAIIDAILERGELTRYHLAHSARGELLRRMGEREAARDAYETALTLTKQEPEQRFLTRRRNDLA